ncbi:hypothetical protein ACFTZ8_21200 [Streptomyces fungicidicus]|uniref:Uncharacterized protein n=3 Tax=Streptomyces TaxID=1883 RepID=A0A494UKK0_9ACTN|nr:MULTISPECIES: hypothetical protein [Streptomyces]AYL35752.1 hypothetical protein CNQ36_10040 [Streptomyces fungicidicus]EFL41684.1 membrane protein [Streptomyces griseoflavus Tu4000]QKW00145.1 hypothetical protein HUT14_09795 [Streptomyces sp. NA02536]
MGDTGRRSSVPRQEPPAMPRLALYALAVCLLAVAAAVVSFVRGSVLIGVVWILLAGLSSNMTWYYVRRGRAARDGGPVTN